MGVPLHVALRGIEQAFDSYEAKPRKRSVKTLLYCQEEVEAQYAEWLESRVGASESEGEQGGAQGTAGAGATDGSSPFSPPVIVEHLQRGRAELLALARKKGSAEDNFSEALDRGASLLVDLEKDFTGSARQSAQQLEVSLTGIERMLNESMLSVVKPDQLDAHRSEVKSQLRPYRSHMEPAVYEKTFDNLLLKRLREQFGVPRLSLFYL
jgi:hypothetical protein